MKRLIGSHGPGAADRRLFTWTSALITVLAVTGALCPARPLASGLPESSIDLPRSPLPAGLSSLMPVPVENSLTQAKIDLGRQLFSERRLSRDGSVSCTSCHQPDRQFTDGRALPVGIDAQLGRRNVPSLINSAYRNLLFWDGRASTLEEQALLPLTNLDEMGHTLDAIVATLSQDDSYRGAFKRAFGREQITPAQIAQALASNQRTLVAGVITAMAVATCGLLAIAAIQRNANHQLGKANVELTAANARERVAHLAAVEQQSQAQRQSERATRMLSVAVQTVNQYLVDVSGDERLRSQALELLRRQLLQDVASFLQGHATAGVIGENTAPLPGLPVVGAGLKPGELDVGERC